jgi:hypothetical protein
VGDAPALPGTAPDLRRRRRLPPCRGSPGHRPRRRHARLDRVLRGLPLQPVGGGRGGRRQRGVGRLAPALRGRRVRRPRGRARHGGRDVRHRRGRGDRAQPGDREGPDVGPQLHRVRGLPHLRDRAGRAGRRPLRRDRRRRPDSPVARRRGPGDVGGRRVRPRVPPVVRGGPALARAAQRPDPHGRLERRDVLGRRRADVHAEHGVRERGLHRVVVRLPPASGSPLRRGRLRRDAQHGPRARPGRRGPPVRRRGGHVGAGPPVHRERDGPPGLHRGQRRGRPGRDGAAHHSGRVALGRGRVRGRREQPGAGRGRPVDGRGRDVGACRRGVPGRDGSGVPGESVRAVADGRAVRGDGAGGVADDGAGRGGGGGGPPARPPASAFAC